MHYSILYNLTLQSRFMQPYAVDCMSHVVIAVYSVHCTVVYFSVSLCECSAFVSVDYSMLHVECMHDQCRHRLPGKAVCTHIYILQLAVCGLRWCIYIRNKDS